MAERTCAECGAPITEAATRGRPRKFCLTCRPRKAPPTAASGPGICVECGSEFVGRSTRVYCSERCRTRANDKRKRFPCASCGELMWRGRTSLPPGIATCTPCRRRSPEYRPANMRARGFVERWTCTRCGAESVRPATKGTRPKLCPLCRRVWRDWLPVDVRRAVYERDAWTCQICLEPVDQSLIGSQSQWRPSLDHIVPQSKGGADDEGNLRLAHMWCNATRGDGTVYTEADFRAG